MSRTKRAAVPFYKRWPRGDGKRSKRMYWKAVRRGDEAKASYWRSYCNWKGW